ncbi:MAG: hypothetical protein Q8L78_04320 [Coxiellaceae bacterium]|nr:hypothetical protein [Coxiellaceae bacterium]
MLRHQAVESSYVNFADDVKRAELEKLIERTKEQVKKHTENVKKFASEYLEYSRRASTSALRMEASQEKKLAEKQAADALKRCEIAKSKQEIMEFARDALQRNRSVTELRTKQQEELRKCDNYTVPEGVSSFLGRFITQESGTVHLLNEVFACLDPVPIVAVKKKQGQEACGELERLLFEDGRDDRKPYCELGC